MALVLYRPSAAHGCPPETVQFGYRFGASPVEVSDAGHLATFAGHPFFEVVSEGPSPDPTPLPPDDPVTGLVAVADGDGYVVKQGDETLVSGLDEAGAAWFNALSDEGKAEWIAKGNSRRILEAKHRGRGSYSVMDGDDEVMEGLTKADADAFNALSDDDKEAYVA